MFQLGVEPQGDHMAGLVSKYLDMLEAEWQEGRTGIQFTEKEDGCLEAVITMRDLLNEFNAIADRYSAIKTRYCSARQLAARCIIERDLIWVLEKRSKVKGIQRYLLTRRNDGADEYPADAPFSLLPGEVFKEYPTGTDPKTWN